jgi:hypothetical protein
MKDLNSLYCQPLSLDDRQRLERALAEQRTAFVRALSDRAFAPEVQRRLGRAAAPLVGFLRRLLALVAGDPAEFRRVVEHGSTSFYLDQLVAGASDEEACLRMVERLSDAAFAWDRHPKAPGLEAPIVPLPAMGLSGEFQLPSAGKEGTCLPLAESLGLAAERFATLWPEIVVWARVMVPVYVDQGTPGDLNTHYSASTGCGSPIFFGRGVDPFRHAEDLVHELQHSRFLLLTPTRAFGSLSNREARFASAYRRDPRPLRGLLLGLHAFLGVNELRLRALRAGQSDAVDRRVLLKSHRANLFAFRTLARHDHIAPEGQALFAAFGAALAEQDEAIESAVTDEMKRTFDAGLAEHIAAAQQAAGAPLDNVAPEYRNWKAIVELAAEIGAGGRAWQVAHAS